MKNGYWFFLIPHPSSLIPHRRWSGWTVLAWLIIFAVVGYLVFWPSRREHTRDRLEHTALELEGRYFVGVGTLIPTEKPALLARSASLDDSAYGKLAHVILVGELGNEEEARKSVTELEREWADRPPSDADRALAELLARQYHAAQGPLSAEERDRLRADLGWFGKLALASSQGQETEHAELLAGAKRTALVVISGVVLGLTLFAVGASLLLIVVVKAWARARSGTLPGLSTGGGDGGVYAEMFALWLLLFVGMSYAVRWLPTSAPRLFLVGLLELASLSLLVWPWLRGVSWVQLRSDLGLSVGKRPGWEVLIGFGCYVTAIPLLLFGLLLTAALRTLGLRLFGPVGPFSPEEIPSHPALDWVVNGDWSVRLQALFVAAVVAPIVEEVFFRGVFYRHLRETTASWGRAGSVAVSALVVSFLFAVIHPQGLWGIPPLMALAFAFALTREWRGSLVPSMIAHALNNGVVTLALLAAVG